MAKVEEDLEDHMLAMCGDECVESAQAEWRHSTEVTA